MKMSQTENNQPDVFRLEYKELSDEQKDATVDIKRKAQELWNVMDDAVKVPGADPRLIAVGKTLLEEAVAMAVKGVTA